MFLFSSLPLEWKFYFLFLVITLKFLPCTVNKDKSESVPEPSQEENKELKTQTPPTTSPTCTLLLCSICSCPFSTPQIVCHHHLLLVVFASDVCFELSACLLIFFAHHFFLHFRPLPLGSFSFFLNYIF